MNRRARCQGGCGRTVDWCDQYCTECEDGDEPQEPGYAEFLAECEADEGRGDDES